MDVENTCGFNQINKNALVLGNGDVENENLNKGIMLGTTVVNRQYIKTPLLQTAARPGAARVDFNAQQFSNEYSSENVASTILK